MNIGFIEDTHLRGGTQIWVTEATEKFLKAGEDVTVIAPEESYVAKKCKALGAEVFTYDWEDIEKNPQKYEKNWIDALKVMDVAVCTVHPPRGTFHCSVYAGKCLNDAQLDTILIPKTGTIVPEYKREFYIPNDSINFQIISITDFTRKYLIENYNIPADKVKLIYQGTEVDRFKSTEQTRTEAFKRYKLPELAEPVLASVGSFEERKGQVVLLDAAKKLVESKKFENLHVMFVGEGPDEEMLKAKTKELGLEEHVSFFPFTSEPNYIFDRIDILTLPSLYKEGLPNVLLEAMSMGIPVISSKMAGVPEIVTDGVTGYMVTPGNVDELADAVVKMWQNKSLYKTMAINARKLMVEKFDKTVQFEEFREYFNDLKKS